MTEEVAEVDIAGVDNDGRSCRGGHCRSGNNERNNWNAYKRRLWPTTVHIADILLISIWLISRVLSHYACRSVHAFLQRVCIACNAERCTS